MENARIISSDFFETRSSLNYVDAVTSLNFNWTST